MDRIVIGYDLSDSITQVSFSKVEEKNISSLATVIGSEKYTIPTVLAKRKRVNQWYYGDEAQKAADMDQAILVDHLLERAIAGNAIVLEEEEFSPITLLAMFMKRTLSLVNLTTPWQLAECIMLTVETLDAATITALKEVVSELPIESGKIRVQSYLESIYYYTIHQPPELWQNQVMVLDYSHHRLKTYRLSMNRRTRPVVAFIEELEQNEMRERNDSDMAEIAIGLLEGNMVTSIYLIGDGFEGDWMKESLKILCDRHRVFQGKNMYTKGACYAALERVQPSELEEGYVYLGRDKLKCNVGMKLLRSGSEVYDPIVDAGVNWYDVNETREVLLGREKEVRLVLTPLTGKNARYAVIRLYDLPDRPERCSRIRIKLSMKSDNVMSIKIIDLGFGELFPSTGRSFQEEITLEVPETE